MSSFYVFFVVFISFGCKLCCGQNVPNPDIIRPCTNVDLVCIRDYFAKHSHCTPAADNFTEPFFIPYSELYLPTFNLTIVQVSIYVIGLRGTVREFYINRSTDKMVLAVEFRDLRINSTGTYYKYHRTAQEPIVTKTDSSEYYPGVTVTSVMPGATKHINILEADSHADVSIPPLFRPFNIGPQFLENPDVNLRTAVYAANVQSAVQEAYLTRAPQFMAYYLKNVICDFGQKLQFFGH